MTDIGALRFVGEVEQVEGEVASIRIFPGFCDGLKGLDDFSHIIVLYWVDRRDNDVERSTLRVIPRKHAGAPEVGVFASRSPSRPNPLGLCVSELLKIDGCTLTVRGLDAFEDTPIVDIKPYLPRADSIPEAQVPEWILNGPKT